MDAMVELTNDSEAAPVVALAVLASFPGVDLFCASKADDRGGAVELY